MPENTSGLDPNIARLASEADARLNKPKGQSIIGQIFNRGGKQEFSIPRPSALNPVPEPGETEEEARLARERTFGKMRERRWKEDQKLKLVALFSPSPDKKPGIDLSGAKDKLDQAGGWVKDKAGEKVGQVKEKVTMSAKELKEKLQNWQKSPFGKAIETALVDFVKKDLPGTIDKLLKEKNIKKILTLAGLKIAGNTATKWALYKTQETAGKMWEKKVDIGIGMAIGAGVRTAMITAGAEAYIAAAIAAGTVGGVKRGYQEFNKIRDEGKEISPGVRERLKIKEALKKVTKERKGQMAKAVAKGAVYGAIGSLVGVQIMEHTGLGNFLHEALASGAGKVGEIAGGIGSAISEAKDHLLPASITPTPIPTNPLSEPGISDRNVTPQSFPPTPQATLEAQAPMSAPAVETPIPTQEITPSPTAPLSTDNLPASPIEMQAPTPVPGATPTPEIFDTAPSIPSEVSAPISVSGTVIPTQVPEMPQVVEVPTIESTPAIPEATSGVIPQAAAVGETLQVEPTSVIDEAIRNIPPTMPLESGGTPWSVAEHLLKSANPDGNFTPGDIMKVDQELCRLNGVAVPEWGIEGKILATRIPVGFILKTDDENLLNIVKQVASSK